MPNIKSQKKRVITNEKAHTANKDVKSDLKTAIKKADAALTAGAEDSKAIVSEAYAKIDKAVKSGVIAKNNASRKKSAVAKKAAAKKAE